MAIAYRAGATGGDSSGTNVTVTKPTGTVDGDILVAVTYREAGAWTLPSGWAWVNTGTPEQVNNAANAWVGFAWKRASSEGASYVFTLSATAWRIVSVGAWSGCLASGNPFDVYTSNTGTITDVTTNSITTTVADTMRVVGVASYDGTDVLVGTSGMTQRAELGGCELFEQTQAATGASGTESLGRGGSTGTWSAWHAALKPATGSTHDLTATGITATPVVGNPAITQKHALTATGIATGAPSVGTPAITQVHGLTATGVSTEAPTVGAPAITQAHALTATGIATGAPVVGNPAIGQVHALTTTGITATPVVGTPVLSGAGVHDLTATGITATPVVSNPAITQVHVLVATGITATPVVDNPALGQAHVLTATGITTTPVVDAPALGQTHALTATGITAAPTVGNPAITLTHVLTALGITATPVITLPSIAQVHVLAAIALATGAPVMGTPRLFGAGTEPTPEWRTLHIATESRTITVASERRILAIPAEDRTITRQET